MSGVLGRFNDAVLDYTAELLARLALRRFRRVTPNFMRLIDHGFRS